MRSKDFFSVRGFSTSGAFLPPFPHGVLLQSLPFVSISRRRKTLILFFGNILLVPSCQKRGSSSLSLPFFRSSKFPVFPPLFFSRYKSQFGLETEILLFFCNLRFGSWRYFFFGLGFSFFFFSPGSLPTLKPRSWQERRFFAPPPPSLSERPPRDILGNGVF